mmetsp:Transcript_41182/g.85982  ORF Transcript_41182/g.85982 Transcript_41182/m.85982 type:complete len:122 (+) Transcript_41182:1281-1646(+)
MGGVGMRWQVAHGLPGSELRCLLCSCWILGTCLIKFSSPVNFGLGAKVVRAGANFVITTMLRDSAKLAAKVWELTTRSCSGSSYLENMADSATAGIFMTQGFEVGSRCQNHFLSGISDKRL